MFQMIFGSWELKTIKNYSCNLSFSLLLLLILRKNLWKTSTPKNATRKFSICHMKQLSDFDFDATWSIEAFSWQQLANQIVFHLIDEEKSHPQIVFPRLFMQHWAI